MRNPGPWILAVAVLGCASPPPDRSTPAGAFAALAFCVDKADPACLLDRLDRDSRWSAQSIYRTLAATRAAVERSYPADRRVDEDVFGAWAGEAGASDPKVMFAAFCRKRRCLETITSGFGAVASVGPVLDGVADVTTTRGATFRMAVVEGEWGLATFREELEKAKVRLADNLAEVERNAAAYDEQRIATGAGADGQGR